MGSNNMQLTCKKCGTLRDPQIAPDITESDELIGIDFCCTNKGCRQLIAGVDVHYGNNELRVNQHEAPGDISDAPGGDLIEFSE